MPTDKSRNNTPNPKNNAAKRLMRSSLKITPSLKFDFGRDTSKTKNQAVKNVPIAKRTHAKCGKTAGLIGETYLVIDSILEINKN
jgi:hypothetical protein